MTCREFMDAAAELTPSQLLRIQTSGQSLAAHAGDCRGCAEWLKSHRLLGNALQTLSAATANAGASPAVEASVLRAFRAQKSAPKIVAMPEPAVRRWWQLSRAFEIGAYAAVAAALIVGAFLGSRLLHGRRAPQQEEQAKVVVAPVVPNSVPQAAPIAAEIPTRAAENAAEPAVREVSERERKRAPVSSAAKAAGATTDRLDYVAMMLCDPLMCSGEEHVVRMELPATTDGSTQQTVLADVVIGDDGLIRGMRIVN